MSKIGRNEPCPCGSGKKYKHCCQDKIKAEQRRQNAQASTFSEGSLEDQQYDLQLAISKATLESVKKLPGNEHGELNEITWRLETEVEFEENRSTIIKIIEELEQYREEYDAWNRKHPEEVNQQAIRLFAEAPFKKMRFTQADIERIVKKQGDPFTQSDPSDFREYICRAMETLLNDTDLKIIGHFLMLQLPVYYSQKRYMDALLILNSVYLLSIFKQKGNDDIVPGFLMYKFCEALKAMRNDEDQELSEFMHNIDLDIDNLTELLQNKETECELNISEVQKAKFAEYLETHPDLHEKLQAELADQQASLEKLLKTREGELLLFKNKEMQPWFARFAEALKGNQRLQRNLNPETMLSNEESAEIFLEILEKVSEEMANEIFTVKRLAQLNQEIQSVQKKLLKQGRKEFNAFLKMWMACNQTTIAKFSPINLLLCRRSLVKPLQQAAMATRQMGK